MPKFDTYIIDRSSRRLPPLLAVCALLLVAFPSGAIAVVIDSTWTGGTGNWNIAGNWSSAAYPNNGADTYNVLIDNLDTGTNSVVTLNATAVVDSVTIDSGDSLSIANSQSLTVVTTGSNTSSGMINNAGTLSLNSTSSSTYLLFTGDLSLSGGGELTLSNSSSNRIYATVSGDRLTNVDNTIRGRGILGNSAAAITNQGIIQADGSGSLTVNPHGTTNVNSGTIRSMGASGSLYLSGTWNNAGGTIGSQDDSTAYLNGVFTGGNSSATDTSISYLGDSSQFIGSTFSTAGAGKFIANASSTPALLDGSTNSGTMEIANGRNLSLANTFTNSGTLTMNSSGSSTYLRVSGDVQLDGGGEVVMGNGSSNRFAAVTNGDRLTNVDNTIRGRGIFGNGSAAITNQGIIQADGSGSLTVNPHGTANVNSGTIRSMGASGSLYLSGTWNNAGGTIGSQDDSTAYLNGVFTGGNFSATDTSISYLGNSSQFIGSTFSTAGAGKFIANASSTPALLDGSTNSGTMEIANGRNLSLANTFTNSGTLTVNSTGSGTYLRIASDVQLDGGGEIVMSDVSSNYFYGLSPGYTLTNEDNTIRGRGVIGSTYMSIDNQGVIQADGSSTLNVSPAGTSNANSNTMRATSGGTLSVSGTWNNAGGLIEAQDNSVANLNGFFTGGNFKASGTGVANLGYLSQYIGATFDTTDTGKFVVTASSPALLDGSTNNGVMEIFNGRDLNLANTFTNTGTLTVNSTGSTTLLQISSDVQLDGGGEIVMSDNSSNYFYGLSPGYTLTNQDNTIRGRGVIGSTNMTIDNQGIIQADGSGPLNVNPAGSGNANSNTMRATSGGTLSVSGTWNNAGGLIEAQDNSVTNLNGTFTGGNFKASGTGVVNLGYASQYIGATFDTMDTGKIVVTASSPALLNSGTNNGTMEMANGRDLNLSNTFTNNGSLSLKGTSSSTLLRIDGNVLLSGTGEIVLGNASYDRFYSINSGDQLTNSSNTIRGMGYLGNGSMSIVNQSIIQADAAGTLNVSPHGTANVNSNTIRATSGGTLSISGTWNNAGGLIEAQDNSVANLNGIFTGGNFKASGTGIANLGYLSQYIGATFDTTETGKFIVTASSAALLDGSTNNGTMEVANGRYLNLANTFTNTGSLTVNSTGSNTYLRVAGDVLLNGGGEIVLSNNASNRFYAVTSGDQLTNVNNTIRGIGTLGNGSMALVNNGTIRAEGTGTLNVNLSGPGTHNGQFEATTGATLSISDDLTGTGSWDANGGRIYIGYNVDALTSGSIRVRNGGELELYNASISGSNLTADSSATIDVGSTISLDGHFSFAMTDESQWDWDSSGILEMTGGVAATTANWDNWGRLEIGGEDLGTNPITHVGLPVGFSNTNFYLPRLVVGADAHVVLVDLLNNGNRNGSFGTAEALYVDTLEFTDIDALLNLNGLNLYYNTLIGDAGQIIDQQASFDFGSGDVPEPSSLVCLAVLWPLLRLRKRRRHEQVR